MALQLYEALAGKNDSGFAPDGAEMGISSEAVDKHFAAQRW